MSDLETRLREAAEEVVAEFDALVNERVALDGATYETERLCEFRETYIQRLRVELAMAERHKCISWAAWAALSEAGGQDG